MLKTFWVFFGFSQINQIAKPINKYKVIQTGANIQSGGLKEGLISSEYQGSLKYLEIYPPHHDMKNDKKINKPKKINFFDFKVDIFYRYNLNLIISTYILSHIYCYIFIKRGLILIVNE